MFSKRFLSGAALTALTMSMAGVANAQSTASQVEEEEVIVVTGTRQSAEGVIAPEQAARARASVTQEYLETQTSGQTVLNSLNLIPGVNFTSTDAYGSSGGAINMRGFDGARISLTVDGIPLNDTGNYAIYSNQQLDPELIQRANVNLGTTDVDSPTASAVGGTVNYITRIPGEEFGVQAAYAAGSENFGRSFVLVDTGALGPFDTRFFGSYSFTQYDQFVGPGELQKTQYNGGFYQPLGENGDFFRISFHYNENRNNFYYRLSQAQFITAPSTQYFDTCNIQAGGAGAQNAATDGCTGAAGLSYYNFNINPSNTGNIRGQSLFHLGESFTLTVDPSFQYVRANGGGTSVVSETARQLVENSATPGGIDLNHDGDLLDSVRLYAPSNTNTYRYGVTSSLIWDITPSQRLRVGYTWDRGHHRQTGEFGYLRPNGDPQSVFGGEDGFGTPIFNGDGQIFQKRDRTSIASLEQFSAEYRGDFLDDTFTVVLGLRAPQFERELDQHCYSAKGNSSSTQYCTTQDPDTPGLGDPNAGLATGGFVWFDNNGNGTVQTNEIYAPPFNATVSYDDVLPNIGLMWRPAPGHQVFFSYAEGLSAPRTDDLYSGITVNQLGDVQPETTSAYDLGYRYQSSDLLVSTTLWYNQFENRIERSQDPLDPTLFYSRNVGAVDLWGAEVAVAWNATDNLFLYGSAAWTDSELKLTGAQVVDTPDWTFSARAEYEIGSLTLGAQANYVGERFANDANTEVAPAYTTVDLDLRYDIGEVLGTHDTYLQLNVINLFDEDYLAQMSSGTGTGTALYNIGAPQTVMVQLRTEF
ncbi:TonB-dependent receptor [Terricaulis sp.]|uniref:TonB-dependent receptor n=1 Tax=Terricaulis sp. TaxID=2768686 RepID=UPI003784947C